VNFSGVNGAGYFYHPKIELVDSAGGFYTIQVFDANCANIHSNSGNCDSQSAKLTWEMSYPDNPTCRAAGVCADNDGKPTSFKVQVLRSNVNLPTICSQYTVRASNL
jgi:hypothetical protein